MSRKPARHRQQPAPCDSQSRHRSHLATLDQVVNHYTGVYQPHARQEMRWYPSQPNLDKGVEVAALSQMANGKRHPHQRRIQTQVLEELHKRLRALNLRSCRTFHALFEAVRHEITDIK